MAEFNDEQIAFLKLLFYFASKLDSRLVEKPQLMNIDAWNDLTTKLQLQTEVKKLIDAFDDKPQPKMG